MQNSYLISIRPPDNQRAHNGNVAQMIEDLGGRIVREGEFSMTAILTDEQAHYVSQHKDVSDLNLLPIEYEEY